MKIIEENFEGIYGSFFGELYELRIFRVDLLNDLILEICALTKKRADQDLSDADLLHYMKQLYHIYHYTGLTLCCLYDKQSLCPTKNFVESDCFLGVKRLETAIKCLLSSDYSALENYTDDLGDLIPKEIKAQKNFDRIKKTHKRRIIDLIKRNLEFLPGSFMGKSSKENVFDIASFKEILFYGYRLIKGYQNKVISKTAYSKKRDQFLSLCRYIYIYVFFDHFARGAYSKQRLPKTYAVYHERLNYMFECLVKEEKYTQIEAYKDALGYLIPKAIKYPSRTSTNKKKR